MEICVNIDPNDVSYLEYEDLVELFYSLSRRERTQFFNKIFDSKNDAFNLIRSILDVLPSDVSFEIVTKLKDYYKSSDEWVKISKSINEDE